MTARALAKQGRVHVGIGGWTFEPWRGVFYPKGLPRAEELAYAAAHVSSIEINATYYRLQSAASFRKWAAAAPEGFRFSVKGPRLIVNRAELASGAEFLQRFLGSGVLELGDKLGPLLWQFAPNKSFEEADFGSFLELLPKEIDGRKLDHVVEVRHASFVTPAFIRVLREFGTAVVFAEHPQYPAIADVTGDIVYARLQRGRDEIETGYPLDELDAWTDRARLWAGGRTPEDLPLVEPSAEAETKPRDVFVYFIHNGKLRAPAAAMAMLERLQP